MTDPTITPELVQKHNPACEPLLGSDDGKWIFKAWKRKIVAAAA